MGEEIQGNADSVPVNHCSPTEQLSVVAGRR